MTVAVADTQDPSAVLKWSMDWSGPLGANGSPTISTATATADVAGAVVDQVTHDTTTVTFRLACATVPVGTSVSVTVHVVLSDGGVDERTKTIRVKQR